MLNFENELKKFKLIPNIDSIEEQIKTEDIRDVMDLIRAYAEEKDFEPFTKNYVIDKES